MKTTATDKEWDRWGTQNPYFGVLGIESDQLSQSDVESAFFSSGDSHIADVIAAIQRRFPNTLQFNSALDFGCGVGRLLLPLARRFSTATGVDISSSMIDRARGHLTAQGVENTDFFSHVSDIPTDRYYDLVHTYIVLQHIRPEQGYPIITSLVDRVRAGGFFALHLTVGDTRPTRRRLNWLRYRIRPLHWTYNLARRRPWNEPITEMNRYEVHALMRILRGRYEDALLVRDFDQNGHVGVMIIGRRSHEGTAG